MSFCFATEGHSSSRKGNCSGEKNKRTRPDMRRKQRGQTGGLRVEFGGGMLNVPRILYLAQKLIA